MLSRRALEVTTAALTGAFGAAILVSSLQIGVGWTARGVGTGTFPAISGFLIVAGSAYNLVRGSLRAGPRELDWPELRKILAMLLPAVAFVAAIPFIGLHVAAGAYVFGATAAHKPRHWARSIALGIVTPLVLYATFDWAFQVTLPRGLLGEALGF